MAYNSTVESLNGGNANSGKPGIVDNFQRTNQVKTVNNELAKYWKLTN